jgi:phenylpropionate dioxygenase-like ring-hydroxylating dioxygenase large terminal subunit/AcrR family transcriptional regulator
VEGKVAQSTRERRRSQLIDATLSVIADFGISRATLARVGEMAKLSPGIVAFYFKNKDQLLLETLRHLATEFDGAIAKALHSAGHDPKAKLLALADAHLDPVVSEARKVAVWHAFWSEARARHDYQRLCGDSDRAYYATLSGLFRRIVADGDYAHLDTEAIAQGFAGLIDGAWQDIMASAGEYDRAQALRSAHAYLASVFPRHFAMPERERVAPFSSSSQAFSREPTATTLAAWTYHSRELFELECEHLFLPRWHVVCHISELNTAGAYATLDLLGQRAVVVRGQDGVLRAFHNVCRHRAHAVAVGRNGHCGSYLRCPYHGWAYTHDGRLHAVPGAQSFHGLDKSNIALAPVDLEIYLGFAFVRFKPGGASVEELLGPVAKELGHYRIAEMQPCEPVENLYQVQGNWKNVMDNYLEGYHFPTAHTGLLGLMNADYEREVFGGGLSRLSHQMRAEPEGGWSERMYHRLLPSQPHLPAALQRRWSYVSLFPGLSFDIYADKLDYFQVVPCGPGESVMRSRSYALPDTRREMRAARFLGDRINRRVQAEDQTRVESVQMGLGSHSYTMGLLSDKECVLRGFHDWIAQRLPVASLPSPPAPGTLARENDRLLGS